MNEKTLENTNNETELETEEFNFGFESFEDDIPELEKDDAEYPLFPFDEPREITLRNGTTHFFKIPSLQIEKRKEMIQRTVIVTSPAIVNGQNPRQVTVDYSKSLIAYYQDCIEQVSGYAFDEGDDPNSILDAKTVIREEELPQGKKRQIFLSSLIPVKNQRAAAERIYGGKLEIVKPKLKDGQKEVLVLNARRRIHVRQEIGVEQLPDGSFTPPSHVINYFLNEPNSKNLSDWEMRCFGGKTLTNPKGGSMEERIYKVEDCAKLFDSMIDEIKGGSVFGQECDVSNPTQLDKVAFSIKKQIIALVMNDQTQDSGN